MKKDVISIGDAMIAFQPNSKGPMRYVHTFERKVGGAELNLLIGCARLGLETGFLSRFGDDEFGRHIFNFVRGEGIDMSVVELVSGYPTSVYFKEVFEGGAGQSFFYRDGSPTEVITEETVSEDFIKNTRILHITGVFASIHPKNVGILKRAITLAKKHDVKISFDPNIRLRMWSKEEARDGLLQLLPYVDIVMAGEEEAEVLFGADSIANYIEKFTQFGATNVVIKRGEAGSVGYRDGVTIEEPPINPQQVVDTVGAGDGFNAGYLYAYLNGKDLATSLRFGNQIGSIVVEVEGDNEGLPYLDDVLIRMGKKSFVER